MLRLTKPRAPFNPVVYVALALASFWVISFGFARYGSLYWDTARLFPQFHDPLQALNRHGEFPWWSPQYQDGFPSYFYLILNTASATSPLMAAWCAFAWIAGLLGITLSHYQLFYVLHFGFFTPLLFLVALHLFAAQLFRSRTIQFFILIVAAFSPGVVFNTSDIGFLEPLSYALLFGASYFALRRSVTPRTQFLFLLTSLLLVLGSNNATLYWNIVSVPVFLVAVSVFPMPVAWKRTRLVFKTIPWSHVALWLAALAIASVPAFLTLVQNGEVIQPALGGHKVYPFENLKSGNPLEWLTVSLPGFGFDWTAGRRDFSLSALGTDSHRAYAYLGIPALALAFTGFLLGRRALARPLLLAALLTYLVIPLSAHSPLFAALLIWDTPLRACNHFSDVSFKAGGFLVLLFAMALGLEASLRRQSARRCLLITLALSLTASITWSYLYNREALPQSPFFGSLVGQGVLYGLLILMWTARKSTRERNRILALLAILYALDISTHSYSYMRIVHSTQQRLDSGWLASVPISDAAAPNGVGLNEANHPHYYTNRFLMLRPRYEAARQNPQALHLPKVALVEGASGDIMIDKQTYNRWRLNIRTQNAGGVLLRDSYAPHWLAWVNRAPVGISRVNGLYKAIAIPAGHSVVELEFRPPWVGFFLLLSYLLTLTAAAAAVYFNRVRSKQEHDQTASPPAALPDLSLPV